ncbi:hypothetical protein Q9966_005061 [Columba livia]|nr:hypothetical protein Q9966_005061 [Columba livia]
MVRKILGVVNEDAGDAVEKGGCVEHPPSPGRTRAQRMGGLVGSCHDAVLSWITKKKHNELENWNTDLYPGLPHIISSRLPSDDVQHPNRTETPNTTGLNPFPWRTQVNGKGNNSSGLSFTASNKSRGCGATEFSSSSTGPHLLEARVSVTVEACELIVAHKMRMGLCIADRPPKTFARPKKCMSEPKMNSETEKKEAMRGSAESDLLEVENNGDATPFNTPKRAQEGFPSPGMEILLIIWGENPSLAAGYDALEPIPI